MAGGGGQSWRGAGQGPCRPRPRGHGTGGASAQTSDAQEAGTPPGNRSGMSRPRETWVSPHVPSPRPSPGGALRRPASGNRRVAPPSCFQLHPTGNTVAPPQQAGVFRWEGLTAPRPSFLSRPQSHRHGIGNSRSFWLPQKHRVSPAITAGAGPSQAYAGRGRRQADSCPRPRSLDPQGLPCALGSPVNLSGSQTGLP